MKEILQVQYARLCQELGDINFQIYKLSQIQKQIQSKINQLDNLTPQLVQTSDMHSKFKTPEEDGEAAKPKVQNGTQK